MQYINNISCILVFAFLTFSMTIKGASNAILFLMFITTLIYAIKFHKNNIQTKISHNLRKFLICSFLIFSSPFILTFIQFILGFPIKVNYFDSVLRFVLSAACIFLLPFINNNTNNVNNVNNVNNTENNVIEKGLVGIILAAFGLGIWGYLSTNIPHFMWIDSERAWNGFSNPIPYGLICIMFAMMALIFPFSIIQKYYKNCKFLKFLKFLQSEQVFLSIKILAFLAGLYCAYQSGSRIALLVFPLFIFVAVYTKTTLNKRQKFLYLCGFLVLVSTPLLVFNNKFSNRIQDGFNDIEKYKSVQNINKETLSKNNNYNTSMGLRFVMWSEAMKIIKTDNNWIFGIGRSNFMPTMIKLHSEGKVVDEIRATPHPHSEYFNSFVEFGIFGLVSLLLIYLFPLLFYCNKRYLQHKDEAVKFAARSGIILSSGYTIAGIFDCYFWIVSLVNFYILTNVIFMSLILSKTAKLKE